MRFHDFADARVAWSALVLTALLAVAACDEDTLLQGEVYEPSATLPVDPPTVRDGGPADASPTAPPARDGGADAAITSPPSNTCATARPFGQVSGDDGTTTATVNGTCAEYVSFTAIEASSSAIGAGMRVRITLSPQGHDFDLYVFFDPTSASAPVCGAAPYARSETNGVTAETIDLAWGEGSVSNGADDGRTIVVAVTSASGPCPPAATWTLTARGNP